MLRNTSIILCAMMVVVISLFTYYHVRADITCEEPNCCEQVGYGGGDFDEYYNFSVGDPFDEVTEGETRAFTYDVYREICTGNGGCGTSGIRAIITIPQCVAGECVEGSGGATAENIDSVWINEAEGSGSDYTTECVDGDFVIKWNVRINEDEREELWVELPLSAAYATGDTTVKFNNFYQPITSCTLTGLTCPETGIPIGQIGKPSFREFPIIDNKKLCISLDTEETEVLVAEQGSSCDDAVPVTNSGDISELQIDGEDENGNRTGFKEVLNVTDDKALRSGDGSCAWYFFGGNWWQYCG